MGLKASMIRFQNPMTVPTMLPTTLCLGWGARTEAKIHMYYVGFTLRT
jgi:hypothetical protein